MMNAIKGESEVEIGGRLRVLKFGTNATALFCQLHGIGLGGFATVFSAENITPATYRDLIYCALVSGARKSGSPVDFDKEDVGDWIDELTEEQLTAIFDVFGASSAKGGEGKPQS
jgi:hypothetical protein